MGGGGGRIHPNLQVKAAVNECDVCSCMGQCQSADISFIVLRP